MPRLVTREEAQELLALCRDYSPGPLGHTVPDLATTIVVLYVQLDALKHSSERPADDRPPA